jgi:hypothetical protein
MTTLTSTAKILSLTETMLGLPFVTDEEATEVAVGPSDSGATAVHFAAIRVAPAVANPTVAAVQVADLWVQYGYFVTNSHEESSESVIVDAHTPAGDTLTCQMSPVATVLTGETAEHPSA